MSYEYVGGDTFFDDAEVNVLDDLPRSWGGGAKLAEMSDEELFEAANADLVLEETDEELVMRVSGILGRKFEVADLTHGGAQGTLLYEAAETWLPTQVDADFEWLADLAKKFARGGGLTDGQAKGVLNCMIASMRRKSAPVAARPAAPVNDGLAAEIAAADAYEAFVSGQVGKKGAADVSHGFYTVVLGNGERRTIRISKWGEDRYRKGHEVRWIGFLSGSDNGSDYTTFARQHDSGEWVIMPKFRANGGTLNTCLMVLFGADSEKRAEAREAYALESGRCSRCNRMLTVPASIHRGLGPECSKMNF